MSQQFSEQPNNTSASTGGSTTNPFGQDATCCGGSCVSKKSNDLLTWKDPMETGKYFGSIVLTLISLKCFNIVNLFLRLSFYVLILSAVSEYAGKLILGTGFVTKFRPPYTNFLQTNASKISGHITDYLKFAEVKVQELIYSKDIETTFKFAIATYFLYKITSWFSIFTLLLTSTILVFSLPLVYETNKAQIDDAVKNASKIAKAKTLQFQEVAKEKSSPYLAKAGPVGSFIQSKLPKNRTATTTVGSNGNTSTVKPEMDEPIKAKTTGIDLPNVPTNTFPTSTTTDNTEVDINALESEIKKNQVEASTLS